MEPLYRCPICGSTDTTYEFIYEIDFGDEVIHLEKPEVEITCLMCGYAFPEEVAITPDVDLATV